MAVGIFKLGGGEDQTLHVMEHNVMHHGIIIIAVYVHSFGGSGFTYRLLLTYVLGWSVDNYRWSLKQVIYTTQISVQKIRSCKASGL